MLADAGVVVSASPACATEDAILADVSTITDGDKLLAILVPGEYRAEGISFFTPNSFSQQMAYMAHPAGKTIQAHVHNEVKREVVRTNEALFVRKGVVRVDFYADDRRYLFSRTIRTGDVLLLVAGGHGFEVLEDAEMVEIKQGPYIGDQDKTVFEGIGRDDVVE